ncbi:MAG: hypothetical protein WCB04_14480 [Mycobacteriales bacterium]
MADNEYGTRSVGGACSCGGAELLAAAGAADDEQLCSFGRVGQQRWSMSGQMFVDGGDPLADPVDHSGSDTVITCSVASCSVASQVATDSAPSDAAVPLIPTTIRRRVRAIAATAPSCYVVDRPGRAESLHFESKVTASAFRQPCFLQAPRLVR